MHCIREPEIRTWSMCKKTRKTSNFQTCCCNLTAIRVALRCLICLELQSGLGILQNSAGCHRMKKLHRGHFDSTELKKHPSSLVFYDVWRPLQAIAPLTPVLTPVSLRFSRRTQLLRNHQHHHCIASAFCRCSPISSACWPVSNRLLGLIMVFPFFLPKVWDTVCTTNLQHLYNRVSLSAWLLLFPLTSKAQWTRVKVVSKRSGTRLTYKICTPSHSGWQQKWGPSQFSV